MAHDLFVVDDVLPVLAAPTGLSIYDFNFRSFLPCRHPFGVATFEGVVSRLGAFEDYKSQFDALGSDGIRLVHTPEDHLRASTLPGWYPLVRELTPKSAWFEAPPTAAAVEALVGWPAFIKGARQTNHHRRSTSIARSAAEFDWVMQVWANDPILRWQQVVCRQYVELRPVEDPDPDRIPSSFEFRFFFWRGSLVGSGRYWWEGLDYSMTEPERREAEKVAIDAARRVHVPFLVVDIAQTKEGRWLVIECNDGQESGYAGASPFDLWQRIITIERERLGAGGAFR